jgi:hypothetical protein
MPIAPGYGHAVSFSFISADIMRTLCTPTASLPTQAPRHCLIWWAGASRPGGLFQPEDYRAQFVRGSLLAQGVGGFLAVGKEAEKVFRAHEIGSLAADQSRPVMAWGHLHQLPCAQVRRAAQATIVNRLAFLDQSRFHQQCAECTNRLMPVKAAHFLTEAHLLG